MSLSKALLRLREQAAHINGLADSAAHSLDVVEKLLRSSRIGISGEVMLNDDFGIRFDDSDLEIYKASYNDFRHWSHCGREDKILAASLLKRLVDSLTAQLLERFRFEESVVKEVVDAEKWIKELGGQIQ